MSEEKNINELLEKISGGNSGLDSLQDREYIIRELVDYTQEIASGIFNDEEMNKLRSFLFRLDMPSAIIFTKVKMQKYDALSPDFERLMDLLKTYSVVDKFLK